MNTALWKRVGPTVCLVVIFFVGCQRPAAIVGREGTSLDDALASARRGDHVVAVLVVDAGRGRADGSARGAFEMSAAGVKEVVPVVVDLGESRNRAVAGPLHALDAPTLVCMTGAGIIVSRDEGGITGELVRRRVGEAVVGGPALDREFGRLEIIEAMTGSAGARMELAEFLLAHHNDREAIPYLKRVAEDERADLSLRVRAWVAMGRAHLWVVEPEKARHTAQGLMATLGPRSGEAMAGGNLVRGLQDTKAKRYDRAREELEAAVSAAPGSAYGREAAALLAKLPAGK